LAKHCTTLIFSKKEFGILKLDLKMSFVPKKTTFRRYHIKSRIWNINDKIPKSIYSQERMFILDENKFKQKQFNKKEKSLKI